MIEVHYGHENPSEGTTAAINALPKPEGWLNKTHGIAGKTYGQWFVKQYNIARKALESENARVAHQQNDDTKNKLQTLLSSIETTAETSYTTTQASALVQAVSDLQSSDGSNPSSDGSNPLSENQTKVPVFFDWNGPDPPTEPAAVLDFGIVSSTKRQQYYDAIDKYNQLVDAINKTVEDSDEGIKSNKQLCDHLVDMKKYLSGGGDVYSESAYDTARFLRAMQWYKVQWRYTGLSNLIRNLAKQQSETL